MPEIQLRGSELDGVALHYVVEGQGPPVLLVHGLGGFAESWRHNLEPLARQATVYALDLPGFGLSSKPPATYRLPFFVRALHQFSDALGLTRFSLVGHSLGGAIAMAYALTHPAQIERLALISAVVPGFGYRVSWAYRLLALHGLGELIAAINPRSLYRAAIARCFAHATPDEVSFLVDYAYVTRTSPEARAAFLWTLRALRTDFVEHAEPYRRAVALLDLPILTIHGRQDPVVAPGHCMAVGDGCRRVTARWIDGCGHFPQIEHPAAVNAWLAEFLVGRTAPR